MQRQGKKRVDELFQILVWANDEIKKAIEKKQYEVALDILEQCQDAAIGLGTLIEESEGEGFVTVGYIEEFCEQLYQIHEAIIENGRADAAETHNIIAESLTKIENSLQNDIHVSKIAVFMPYKASMWDSLESVWKAADADPDCEAYVIPIPYYEKNKDGSLGTMYYEGKEYPPDVPITDYQTYDFGANRPDMIFIHNPYDEYNYVTSVHPFFYSSRLKELTDMLVYIPYFVSGEIDPDNKPAVDRMKHFCTTPAVLNADYVFVQSENIRQIYIRELIEWSGGKKREIWENKIKGFGSPKYDCVISYDTDRMEIPDEWTKIIFGADGVRKKIVLYNVGLGALLAHEERMMDKIERTLERFYEERDKVTLFWRPHPLYKETLRAMHPELMRRYEHIVEKYKTAGWGIYDESADLERAIGLSDAYYGDGSSVTRLFQKVKKPVMIQNVMI